MAKYRLKPHALGWGHYLGGVVYDEFYSEDEESKKVWELVASFPDDWELISDTPDRMDQLIEKWEKILPAYEEETKLNPDNKIYSCVRLIKAFVTDLKSLKV